MKKHVNQVKGAGKFWDSVRIGEERVQAFELERMPTLAWQFRICDVQLASYAGSSPLSLKYGGLTKAYPRLWWLMMSLFAQPWSRRGMFVFHLVPSQWRK